MVRGRGGDLENICKCYMLLATLLSFTIRHHRARATCRYVCHSVTALLALFFYLFLPQSCFVVIERVSRAAFLSSHFLCSMALSYAIENILFVMFYLSFYFFLAPSNSARDFIA